MAMIQCSASAVPTIRCFDSETKEVLRTDALCQLSYCNGLKAGWNFCVDDNEAGYSNAMNGVIEAVRVLKQNRDTEPPAVVVDEPDPSICFNAAINYALKCGSGDGGLEFLACWREGNFDAIRKEWPDAPSAVFEGAETAKKGGV